MSKNYELLRKAGRDFELIFNKSTPSLPVDSEPVHLNGGTRVREEVLKLIQRTFLNGVPGAPRRVVFSAVDHGNGCSWVCARAAEALAAHVEGSVCVVEANARTPSLHRYFGVSPGSGFLDAMLQQGPVHDFARPIRGSNLWLMCGRALPSEGAGILSSEHLKVRFAELCAEFSYVLIDAPPVNESAESVLFGRMADGVVLVLEAHVTHREAARSAKENLEAANVRLLGAVLNKRTFPIPRALYKRV